MKSTLRIFAPPPLHSLFTHKALAILIPFVKWVRKTTFYLMRLCCMNLVGSQIFPIPFRPQATFTDLGAAI
jgi:hypothetical protein